nr:class I SAM-dependent methyltransferase [Oribacterium sp.]
MTDTTLNYYNNNAEAFIKGTVSVDFSDTQDKFLSLLSGKKILDFGCGSGRDTKYFLKKGFQVDAIDGSAELCRIVRENINI